MSSVQETENEGRVAQKVRQALDARAAALPTATLERLAAARHAALGRKKPEAAPVRAFGLVFAGSIPGGVALTHQPRRRLTPMWRVAASLAAIAVALIALAGIAHYQDLQRQADLADIDAAMINDVLPLRAYVDHGFNAYLARSD